LSYDDKKAIKKSAAIAVKPKYQVAFLATAQA